jgi:hypothetical protein
MPFRRAAEVLASLTGVQVSEATARRWTEATGAAACAVQEERADAIRHDLPPAPQGAERLLMSADGAFVPLLHGQWAEAKVLVLGEVTTDPAGEPQTSTLSYFGQVAEAETFSQAAVVETHQRGVERAQEVCAVLDGAEWLQGLVDDHRADAVRMLDFAQAAEYVSQIGQAVQAAGTALAPTWLDAAAAYAQARRADPGADRSAGSDEGASRPGGGAECAHLLGEARGAHAVSQLAGDGLADWVGERREWTQSGHASAAQRSRHALESDACQPDARVTNSGM